MQSIFAGVSKLDIFGQLVFLRINRQPNYKSVFGGCASIGVFTVMAFVFITNFISYSKKEQLKVISIQEYDNTIDQLQFDDDDFMFAVQIEQEDFITRPVFNITMQQKLQSRSEDGSLIESAINIEMIPCTIERFTEVFNRYQIDFTQQFQTFKLSNYLCPCKNANISVGGTSTSKLHDKLGLIFSYVELAVMECQNNTSGLWQPTCASQDQKKSLLRSYGYKIRILSVNLQYFLSNRIINPFKPKESYIQPFIDDSLAFTFSQEQTLTTSIQFTKYQFLNDESLLPISMIEESNYFVIDPKDVSQDVTVVSSDSYLSCQFRKKQFKIQFQRQYQKLDELLSNLGGILQIVSFFIGLLVTIYNRISYMVELANKVFEFSYDNHEQHQIYQEHLQILQDQQNKQKNTNESKYLLTNQRVMTETDQVIGDNKRQYSQPDENQYDGLAQKLNCANGLDYFQNQLKKMFEKRQPISMSLQIFLNYISCNKLFSEIPRVKLMNKAYEQIITISDIHYVLTKLNEIEKLKEVILTPKQLVMFNFTPKPLITLESGDIKIDRDMVENQMKSSSKDNKLEFIVYAQMMLKHKKKEIDSQNKRKTVNSSKRGSFMPESMNNYVYRQIYCAYEEIFKKKCETNDSLNSQLVSKLGPELESIYKVCKMIDNERKPASKKHWKIISTIQQNQALVEDDVEKQE